MKVRSNVLKAIFLRKGKEGEFTKVGNVIPGSILTQLDIAPDEIIVSFYRNAKEWLLLTGSLLAFAECENADQVKLDPEEIAEVRPFSSGTGVMHSLSTSRGKIYIRAKSGEI